MAVVHTQQQQEDTAWLWRLSSFTSSAAIYAFSCLWNSYNLRKHSLSNLDGCRPMYVCARASVSACVYEYAC